ncbi:hypothetical protein BDV30DRAFT_225092 [Aspergillus minisclerotigenes]|uniref:Uncharacterized protein n=1 Tax=Aspergillus minisclerotigenes TaxID=656917 RepID=A0A5N6J8X3_9EURO|nr:hypothetical protein BDV30DRAFT_225092 [Aspergillus minisclerotigenes]
MFRSLITLTRLGFPESIFPTVDLKATVKIYTTLPMYGYIKQFHAHILVATGKTDWMGKVEQEKGSLMEAFKSDPGKSKHVTVLLLPSFTFVDGVSYANVRYVVNTFIDNPKQESHVHMSMLFFSARINFAANVLIYGKKEQQMIWLGRVKPEPCEGVVKYTILQGKVVHPDSQLRGGFDRMRGLTSW